MTAFLAGLFGFPKALFVFYAPIFKSTMASSMEVLLPLAIEVAIAMAASQGKTGNEKRDEALAILQAKATEQGLVATESLLRYTLESAVLKLKTEGKA